MVITYALTAWAIYLLEICIFSFYMLPKFNYLLEAIIGFKIDISLLKTIGAGFANLNIFIDLFLCSALYFFVVYKPQNINKTYELVLFRMCALLPICYIVGTFILKGIYLSNAEMNLSIYLTALFPSKGIIVYFIFGAMLVFCKYREKIFNFFNNDVITYNEYKNTSKYKINYSIIISLIFILFSLVDYLLGFIPNGNAFGFGDALSIMLAIPFILLHDFSLTPKYKHIDMIIGPIYGVSFVIIFCLYLTLFIDITNLFSTSLSTSIDSVENMIKYYQINEHK